ncbi:UPF0058 family protein [Haloarcula sp. JP-L23]|uniref:UPF0058 family protein n=1 Tax=Haloarcula sp. JP-L23 TaxID=2716717 RepID=UPI00140F1369|nr:metal-binding protein [Haloarcula sp. JP-L23]
MRKHELVHIHGLLVLVRRHLAEQEEIAIPTDAFDVYDAYGVRPTAIAERKDTHKTAIRHLLTGLNATLATEQSTTDTR